MPSDTHRSAHVRPLPGSTLGAGVLVGAAFVILAALVATRHGPPGVDTSLGRLVDARAGSSTFKLGTVGSFIGHGPVVALTALVVGAYLLYRTRELFLAAAVPAAPAVAGVLELATKHLVKRPRPPTARLTGKSGFGFPSGHTTGFTAMAVALVAVLAILVFHNRQVIVAAIAAAITSIVVAVSRLLVGAHWATDVIGGLLLGATVGIAMVEVAVFARPRALAIHRRVPGFEEDGVSAHR